MPKIRADLTVCERTMLTPHHALLTLTARNLPVCRPGQFVNVRVRENDTTFLRRPISIHYYNGADRLQLLVHDVGPATHALCQTPVGHTLDCLLPLGNGFTLPTKAQRALLIGGGVGVAPLLFLAEELKKRGSDVTFILGGKTKADILRTDAFQPYGHLFLTTEDGSAGTRGFVTQHPAMQDRYEQIYTCGPKPMMQAVAHIAKQHNTPCEASLENLMACGLGACLCCVEKTTLGHRCTCTEGPVFDTRQLLW